MFHGNHRRSKETQGKSNAKLIVPESYFEGNRFWQGLVRYNFPASLMKDLLRSPCARELEWIWHFGNSTKWFQQWLQVTTNKRLMTSVQFSPSATSRNVCFRQTHDRLSTILNMASLAVQYLHCFCSYRLFLKSISMSSEVWHICITSSGRASHIWDSGIYELSHLNS